MSNKALPSSSSARTAEELVQQARGLMQQQDYDGAWKCLERSLEIGKTSAAFRSLGNILYLRKEPHQAIPYFELALKEDEKDHASLAMMAEARMALGETDKALRFSAKAIAACPEEIRYKERFVFFSENAVLAAHEPEIENTVVECLKTPGLDCSGLQGIWYNIFTLIPSLRLLYSLDQPAKSGFLALLKGAFGAPAPDAAAASFNPAPFDAAPKLDALLRPFFLLGLEKLVVYSLPFEAFLVRLRKSLLQEPRRYAPKARLQLASALSHYSMNSEFILDTTPEEEALLRDLPDDAESVALRACYAPLFREKDAEDLVRKYRDIPELRGVLKTQIESQLDLQKARDYIPSITPIDGGVSADVRQQYEESPYPKWRSIPRNLTLEPVALRLKAPGAKILVAGCGTGLEAAQMASVLPEADILAIDLSLSSLSYAKTQTEALGFKNITFRQADILHLGALEEKFDGIVSGGVLHHLQEPMKGWKVLTGLLKDNGLMRIALYSKIARRHVTKAQQSIKQANYPATPEGIRRFRKEIRDLLSPETLASVTGASDYYHMSMVRDLLFHVQEHCFDIPELKESLKGLNLEFLNFILPQAVTASYLAAYPDDDQAVSLENWHKFEQDNPDTFIGMYQFWCRKK